MSRIKNSKNLNIYVRKGTDMNIEEIAKELKLSKTEVETALKGIIYKFRKYMKNNNFQKEHFL
jgi:DNA-binding transcriptional regulator GbsR (MarR family)